MRDEQIINSREMILKVFSNIDKKRFEEKDSVENAWKKITTSIKNLLFSGSPTAKDKSS